MESGTSTNTTNTHDWRNYRSENVAKPATAPATSQKRSRANNHTAIGIAIFSALLGCAGIVFGVLAFVYALNNGNQPTTVVSAEGYYTGNSVEFEESSIAGIASKVTPAVVSIVSSVYTTNYFGYGSTGQAAGTGMIVTSDGYVLTNKHVIEGATDIKVITDAGDTYENVEVVGTDPLNDVAYLKINGAKDLPIITLGDSKTIAVGQPVLAIGNALGAYQNSVTQGIISGTGREVAAGDSDGRNVEYLTDMLQTDAAINPGNSGGPLVNAAGDVIGINTAVSSSANGLGFAIPISATKGMLNNIIKNNKAERAYIGVSYTTITAEIAKKYNLSVNHGAYIKSSNGGSAIVKNGPADKAGLEDGDIITKVGTVEVGRAGSVSTLVGEFTVGDTVAFTILRNGEEKTINITLGAYK